MGTFQSVCIKCGDVEGRTFSQYNTTDSKNCRLHSFVDINHRICAKCPVVYGQCYHQFENRFVWLCSR